jgi:HAMP domain-containing protein
LDELTATTRLNCASSSPKPGSSRFPLEATPARHPGLIPAAALLALAVSGLILLRRVVVAPIRRLRSDAVAVASGELEHRVHQSGVKETRGGTYALAFRAAKRL